MRLAIIVPLALAVAVGTVSPAAACPVDTVTGPITETINSITNLLGLTSPPPADTATPMSSPTSTTSSNTTTNNFVTNNFITNTTSGAGGAAATTAAGVAPLTLGAATGGGGGGVGGGGGGLGGGGFSGAGTGISGMPHNPSSDFGPIFAGAAGGGTGGGAGTGFGALGSAVAASGDQTPNVGFAMASPASDGPLTAGVAVAALPAATENGEPFVGMASPRTGAGNSTGSPSAFGFDGPAAAADGPPPGAGYGGLMLAGLVGVGVLGAGWAWKSLVV